MYNMSAQYTDDFSRFMVDAFDERIVQAVPTGFQAFFGDPSGGSETVFSDDAETVEIDIVRANGEKLAALVNRGKATMPTDVAAQTGEKFSNFVREYPLIETASSIESSKLLKRMPGENPFSGRTRFDRMRQLALKLNMESTKKAIRMFEYLASQAILEGQHPAIFGTTNTDLIYDFLRDSTHIITVGNSWNSGSQTILADIDGGCAKIEENAYMTPNFIGIGEDAMGDFVADTDVQSNADNRRFELIEVSTNNPVPPEYARFVNNGWIPRGRLRTPGGRTLWMFNYNANYLPLGSSTITRFLPKDQAIICDINARADRYFGPPDRLPVTASERAWYQEMFGFAMDNPVPFGDLKGATAGVVDSRMFSYYGYAKDKKTVELVTQSAPIFPTTQTDAFVTLKGLHT
jgi:hypothetical protein